MSSTRTIEDYVKDIVKNLDENNYLAIQETYRTLKRMKVSHEKKHELNFWRVLQCIGEVAIEKIVQHLLKLEKNSSKYEVSSNLLVVLGLFSDTIFTVAVIKRVVHFADGLYPIFFRCVRQFEELAISSIGFGAMYRFILVGKENLVVLFMKYGLLKDLYQHIKMKLESYQFNTGSVTYVHDCTKVLHAICVYGTDGIRKQVKRHPILVVLSEFVNASRGKSLTREFTEMKQVLSDEQTVQAAQLTWKTKVKLREHLEEIKDFTFCSTPSCRKRADEFDKFLYCGACRLTRYCSAECQKDHWKNGGHKGACLKQSGSMSY